MKADVKGRVRNTNLPKTKALLPLFEAVVNAFQAIEDTSGLTASPSIDIAVERDPMLPNIATDGDVIGFTIVDNGIGFNDANVESFFVADTQYKLAKGGKGIGRFTWLKAFEYAEIESHHHSNGNLVTRAFRFTSDRDEPTGPVTSSKESQPKTSVRLVELKSPYKESCPRSLQVIGHRLVEHCLPFFVDPKCPAVSISDVKERIDLNGHFRDTFLTKATRHTFSVRGMEFTLTGFRLHNAQETQHHLLYAANSREVFEEKLDNYVPNLQKKLKDENGPFVYLGFVEGEYLNNNLNNERTSFSFPTDGPTEELFDGITLESIRGGALVQVAEDLRPFLEEINTEKRVVLDRFIAQEAPEYRSLTRYVNEFIDDLPPAATDLAMDAFLHRRKYEKERELKEESHRLLDEGDNLGLKPDEYEERLNDFIERENELGKASLAQYIAHRKVMLDFLEKSLQADPATGKYPLEEIIHRIIYPMHVTSTEVPYDQQNLWIIDERLTHHWYLASDRRLDKMNVLANDSASRPDLLIFNRALSFVEDGPVISSMVVVEFKRPDRGSFPGEDPIDQVYRLVDEIRTGYFKDNKGREIKVQSPKIPAYAYVICDKTEQIDRIARYKGLIETPDKLGYYGYNSELSTYVEIISYDKLLRDAKRRNRVLFEKLNLSTGAESQSKKS